MNGPLAPLFVGLIADRFLPRSCRPRWLKADRKLLERSGGLSINLASQHIESVAAGEGEHGWWRGSAGGAGSGQTARPPRARSGHQ